METGNRLDDVAAGVIRPLNQAEAKLALSLLKEIGKAEPSVAELVKADGPLKAFLVAAFSLSPFLRDVASIRPKLLADAIDGTVEDALAALVDAAREAWRPVDARIPSENEVMTALRNAKRAFGFLLALADLARIFSARDTTRWLSEFAQAST
ncbi:MAG: bifunctional [glutamine synthetase] adenylyltransferase/[glutamine synthetase]-adenylyl-L-tyrosine phosphorylase, partial [Oxalobacteraceae bacterium]